MKRLGSEDAQHVATQPHAYIVCQERAVAVAVGAEDGIHEILVCKVAGEFFVFLADSLGVDRDEGLAAGKRLHRRAQAFKDLHHDVAAHGGMLVHADGEPRKCLAAEKFGVALHVVFFGFRLDGRKCGGVLQHALAVKNGFVEIDGL